MSKLQDKNTWLLVVIAAIIFLLGVVILINTFQISKKSEKFKESKKGKREMKIRKSIIAGSWYPGNASELKEMLKEFYSNVNEQSLGYLVGLVEPHAGYIYSGQVAAYGYRQIKNKNYKKVIILGPSHRHSFYGISIANYTHFETPLGLVKVSEETKKLLDESGIFLDEPLAHLQEHSVEIQLPFLQYSLGNDFEIIPLVVGSLTDKDVEEAANILISHMDGNTLIIASSDLSHYHDYNTAVSLDKRCIDSILRLDYQEAKKCEMCGYYPVLILMKIAEKLDLKTKLLRYANSGDVTGDKSGVVGYAAIAFYAPSKENFLEALKNLKISLEKEQKEEEEELELTPEEKKFLLKLARDTIATYLKEGKILDAKVSSEKLKKKRGVFVTLEKNHELRGCIGYIEPIKPIYIAVRDNAINAAFHDSRFPPLREEELDDIEIEISILTKPELIKVSSPDEYLEKIKPGVDGIIIKYAGRSATYLPQVWEKIPDKEMFLSSLCNKAFLPGDCWKRDGAEIYRYRVVSFKESEFE